MDKFIQQLVPPEPGMVWDSHSVLRDTGLGSEDTEGDRDPPSLPFGDGWQGQQQKSFCIVNTKHIVLNIPLLVADTLPFYIIPSVPFCVPFYRSKNPSL